MKKEVQIVKKAIAVVAFLFAVSLVAQANATIITTDDEIAVVADEFVVVEFEKLCETVQTAIKGECEKNGVTIKEISQHKENKDLKVVAVDAENAEVVYLFCEKGKRKENKE
jgi:hypothetical protein